MQKQLAQEKLKNELMKRQRELATAERISRKVLKHTPSYQASLEDKNNDNISLCPPQNTTFDNAPLPTSRIRAPRKVYCCDVFKDILLTKLFYLVDRLQGCFMQYKYVQ